MASRKSRSSVRSAPRADGTARFSAAIDTALTGDARSLSQQLDAALRSPATQACSEAYSKLAFDALARAGGDRPQRLAAPPEFLVPLP